MYMCVQLTVQMRKCLLTPTSENWIKDILPSPWSVIPSLIGQGVPGHRQMLCLSTWLYVSTRGWGIIYSDLNILRNLWTNVVHPTEEYKLEIPVHAQRRVKLKPQGTWDYPSRVIFASAWQAKATTGGTAQVRLPVLWSPVDLREAGGPRVTI